MSLHLDKAAQTMRNAVILRGQARTYKTPDGATIRETPTEIQDRVLGFHRKHFAGMPMVLDLLSEIEPFYRSGDVFGSQRAEWSAGPVAERDETALYNCAAFPIDNPRAFGEGLWILMQGTGVGFSVELDIIAGFPKPNPPLPIPEGKRNAACFEDNTNIGPREVEGAHWTHVVTDSTEGWKDAVDTAVFSSLLGYKVGFDVSKVRPEGAPLKTKGGKASGPGPLLQLLGFIQSTILKAGEEGRALYSDELADIVCLAGAITEVGGVRRAALLCMCSPEDPRMAHYKSGKPGQDFPTFRFQCNISWTWRKAEAPPEDLLNEKWAILQASGTGEPGIISTSKFDWRLDRHVKQYQEEVTEGLKEAIKAGDSFEYDPAFARRFVVLFNPCVEIALVCELASPWCDRFWSYFAKSARDFPDNLNPFCMDTVRNMWTSGGGQFCNLTSAIITPYDEKGTLMKKARAAGILGRLQADYTNFPTLREGWKRASELDRLVGVSLSGHASAPWLTTEDYRLLREYVIDGADLASLRIADGRDEGMQFPAAYTCGKPDGTTAARTGGTSGMSPWYAEFFIRRLTMEAAHPVAQLLLSQGVPAIPATWQETGFATQEEAIAWAASFPRAPMPGDIRNTSRLLFEFPRKAPEGARIAGEGWTTTQSLDLYKMLVTEYADHNISNTNYISGPEDWDAAKQWVRENFEHVCGLTFFAEMGTNYYGIPYQSIQEKHYEALAAAFPDVDWALLPSFETGESDDRGASGCTGGKCDISI
jgi:ribonucleoside-triphosphate reductase